MQKAPVIAICHGGGPMPLLNDPSHKDVIYGLRNRVPAILNLTKTQKPRAILLLTAHWETSEPSISSGSKHELYYDYGGFPREAYSIKYDAPGSPEIAQLVAQTLSDAGIKSKLNPTRGWDHGVFVPMKLINPAADVPIIQMSVLSSQSPADLYRLGKALQPLRNKEVAIIGSGSASFHNLRQWFTGGTNSASFKKQHVEWASALDKAMLTPNPDERGAEIEGWRKWPNSSSMHPLGGAEHLSPLIVCAGAAGEQIAESWSDELMGVDMKSYYWK